jgi:hypothetical protein
LARDDGKSEVPSMPSFSFAASVSVTAAAVLMLSACGSVTKQALKLETDPPDVVVLSRKGKPVGRTPFVIDGSNRDEFESGNGYAFILSKDGYRQREVHFTNTDIFEYKVTLAKLSDDDFGQVLGSDYGVQMNDLSQHMLEAHAAVIAGDLTRAESLLNALIDKHKKIGPIYTLKALVAIKRKDYAVAQGLLRQALLLNKNDQTAQSFLSKLQKSEEAAPVSPEAKPDENLPTQLPAK